MPCLTPDSLGLTATVKLLDPMDRYRRDPALYARERLRVRLIPEQATILHHLTLPPYKVLVPSGHNVGKTFLAACAINWWYDAFDPGLCITLGPKYDSLKDTVWAEVRLQRARAGLSDNFIGPSAPEMRSSPEHWAKGITAIKDAAVAGRHRARMLFVLEEAGGIEPVFWEVLKTMFDPSLGHGMLAIFNPTDTTSQAYIEDTAVDAADQPAWHRFRLNAMSHPNLAAELAGRPKPIPGAVSVAMVDEWVRDWAEPCAPDDRTALDVEWPPASGKWYRCGPVFQSRVLGLWPDSGAGVWSEALWEACVAPRDTTPPRDVLPQIGCDTATGKGEDFHAIHARWGDVSIHHETANTMKPDRILARLKAVAQLCIDRVNVLRHPNAQRLSPKQIPIKVDDDGVGGTLCAFLRAAGYTCAAVNAASKPMADMAYPRKRDELWFQVADRARLGKVYLGGLDRPTQRRLKQQLMAPEWKLDAAGRRQVESKDDTKEKIGRSPDDADALNLAFLEGCEFRPPESVTPDRLPPPEEPLAKRLGLFGR